MLKAIFKTYKYFFSQVIHFIAGPGYGCRFVPSCSEYCEEAIKVYGPIKGGVFSLKRLLKCQPLGRKSGWDPIPEDVNFKNHWVKK